MVDRLILSIVTFSLVSTIVANLMSDSVYRKYISGFAGILFVIMIIKPVISLLGDGGMDKLYDKIQFQLASDEYKVDSAGWEEEYIETTQKEYEALVEEKIGSLIGDLCEVNACLVEYEKDTASSNYGEIYKIKLEVSAKGMIKEDEAVGEVEKITIGEKAKEKSEDRGYKEMLTEIKKRMGEHFDLKEEMIIIDLQ